VQEGHTGVVHTSPKEVQGNSNDLLIWELNIGILIQPLFLTVLNEAVCDVPDVALGRKDTQVSKIPSLLSFFFFFFLVVLGLELRAYNLSHSTSPFL
jgi:hypothetical protein